MKYKGALIFIFGDSVAQGLWDPDGGWVGRLNKTLMRVPTPNSQPVVIYNLAVSSETTDTLLKRFTREITSRLRPNHRTLVIFSVGARDARLENDKKPAVPPERFKRNLITLIGIARKITPDILLVGPAPVREVNTAPYFRSPSGFYRNEPIRRYSEALKEMSGTHSLPFVNIFDEFQQTDYSSLLEPSEGLHPNTRGYELIFARVAQALARMGIIQSSAET